MSSSTPPNSTFINFVLAYSTSFAADDAPAGECHEPRCFQLRVQTCLPLYLFDHLICGFFRIPTGSRNCGRSQVWMNPFGTTCSPNRSPQSSSHRSMACSRRCCRPMWLKGRAISRWLLGVPAGVIGRSQLPKRWLKPFASGVFTFGSPIATSTADIISVADSARIGRAGVRPAKRVRRLA